MNDYRTDRRWSDKFIPEIRDIVGPLLLIPSNLEQDRKQAADLIVLIGHNVTVACRVRRPGYHLKYGNQFTIRSGRDNGTPTEMEKIADGWGDWMFYAHSNEAETGFAKWMLLDLKSFRNHLIRQGFTERKTIVYGKTDNGDGTHFMWFDALSFLGDPKLIITSNENVPHQPRIASLA